MLVCTSRILTGSMCRSFISVDLAEAQTRQQQASRAQSNKLDNAGGFWMKQRSSHALAIAALVILLSQPLRAEVLQGTKTVGATTVHHKTVLPNGYDPARAYPAILAFGGGPQTMNTVDNILNRNFRAEAEKRGYIVVAPAAPEGELFFLEGDRIFPEFLKMILADHKVLHNK